MPIIDDDDDDWDRKLLLSRKKNFLYYSVRGFKWILRIWKKINFFLSIQFRSTTEMTWHRWWDEMLMNSSLVVFAVVVVRNDIWEFFPYLSLAIAKSK